MRYRLRDRPGYPLISSVSGGHPLSRDRRRSRLVSSSSSSQPPSPASIIAVEDVPKRVSHVPCTAISWLAPGSSEIGIVDATWRAIPKEARWKDAASNKREPAVRDRRGEKGFRAKPVNWASNGDT
ncbi:unnamed protein product [Lasius platythorax]|uniref:Uncharacterized protein n=1 Tax=Lasius platythorax TaxID=488582 RepID=A0AAV2N7P6_9HYME